MKKYGQLDGIKYALGKLYSVKSEQNFIKSQGMKKPWKHYGNYMDRIQKGIRLQIRDIKTEVERSMKKIYGYKNDQDRTKYHKIIKSIK